MEVNWEQMGVLFRSDEEASGVRVDLMLKVDGGGE